jgi:hypothetical protein
MASKQKKLISIDFDGVIHSYHHGWKDGSIYGDVVPGFFEWAAESKDHFRLAIFSSRSRTPEGIEAMRLWLLEQWIFHVEQPEFFHLSNIDVLTWFEFPTVKPMALLSIDDRARRFDGNWNADALKPARIAKYRPWNYRNRKVEFPDTIESALSAVPADYRVELTIFGGETKAVIVSAEAFLNEARSGLCSIVYYRPKSFEATAPTTAEAIRGALAAYHG